MRALTGSEPARVAFVALALVPTGSVRAEATHADRLSGVGRALARPPGDPERQPAAPHPAVAPRGSPGLNVSPRRAAPTACWSPARPFYFLLVYQSTSTCAKCAHFSGSSSRG
jgi:hypothetical protein